MGKITENGFDLEKLMQPDTLKNYSTGHTLKINKEEKSFSTYDDGLLVQFPQSKYEHMTYWCRTSTPNMDTCNVKLFRMEEVKK